MINKLFKYRQIDVNGCWNWTGATSTSSTGSSIYGRYRHQGHIWRVHRLSYLLHHPMTGNTNFMVLHKCGNSLCFNPAHLYLGDASDNAYDSIKEGTHYFTNYPGRHH